ncbi:hypothetical protein H2201_007570 [Coniosporium apollinis]|uniref:Uncharacterized protein n=1 Tax=Coniosporium apollinis TaxID=61459 RepID=A0ABQ9NIX6_9PEZI|nr:hypothetical protein H2201_007570 [Coniosporium apollinis]
MASPFSYHQGFSFSPQEHQGGLNDTQLVGTPPINVSQTPRASYRTLSDRTRDAAHLQTQLDPDRLRFLELDEWDGINSYEEEVPTLLHYSVEWKVVVNNKVVARDTEQDVVLVPIAYWHMVLEPKLQKLLQKKYGANRQVQCDDTNVIVSVSDRTQRDLVKRFDELKIEWPIIAKQLEEWSERFRSEQGNALRDHNDVPEEIREQLLLEERQRLERQAKPSSTTSTPYPPINITNVLPQSHQSPSVSSIEATPAAVAQAEGDVALLPEKERPGQQ